MPYMGPYHEGNEWCIYKKHSDGSRGKKVGCSATKEAALAYLHKLEMVMANESIDETEQWWITADEMRTICTDCADKMDSMGFTRVNVRQMPRHLLEGMCSALGGADGFFERCKRGGYGPPGADRDRFCAWLKHECHGVWPGQHSMSIDDETMTVQLPAEIESPDHRHFIGGAVRAVGNGVLEGYLVPFNTPANPDFYDTYFDRQTNFMFEDYPIVGRAFVLYHHGLDGQLRYRTLGEFTHLRVDDLGIWVQAQLKLRDEWEEAVYKLAQDGKFGWSSGTWANGPEVEDNGHVKTWPIIDGSLTPTPAAVPFASQIYTTRSYQDALQRAKDGTARIEPVQHDPVENSTAINVQTNRNQEMRTMADNANRNLAEVAQMLQGVIDALMPYVEQEAGAAGEPMPAAAQEEMMTTLTNQMSARLDEIEDQMKAWAPEETRTWLEEQVLELLPGVVEKYQKDKAAREKKQRAAVQNAFRQVEPEPAPGFVGGNGATQVNVVGRAAKPGLLSTLRSIYTGNIRDQNPYIGPLGGYLVGQEISQDILDPLRASVVMFDMGVQETRVDGIGIYSVPKMTSAPTAYRPGINQSVTASNANFDMITAYLRPIAAQVIIPRQLLMSTQTNAEQKIKDQAERSIRLQIDKEILIGEGTVVNGTGAEIKGILSVLEENTTLASSNIATLATNGRVPKFSDLTAAETQVTTGNVDLDGDTSGWVMHPRTRGTFRSLTTTTGEPLLFDNYGQEPYPEMIGYRVAKSTQVPIDITTGTSTDTSYIFLGNYYYSEYVMGNNIEVIVDEVTLADKLQVRIIFYTYSDFIVHYPEAFYVMKGVRAS